MSRALVGMLVCGLAAATAGCRESNPAFVLEDPDAAADDAAARPSADRPAAETPAPAADRPPATEPSAAAPELPAERPPSPPDAPQDSARPEAAPPDATPLPDLTTGLIGYWKLDDGAGTMALDSSGYGHHGAIESIEPGSAWTQGRIGGAVEFPATNRNAGIRVPLVPAIDGIKAFTLAAWAYRTSIVADRYMSVISRQLGTTAFDLYNLSFIGDTFLIELAPAPMQQRFNIQSPRKTPLRQWIHVAATFDGMDVRLYLDGAEVATFRYPYALPSSTTPLYLGANKNPNNPEPMVGRLDEVVLYARALPPAAIAALAAGAPPR